MLEALHDRLAPAALARAVLLANHVLAGEPAATERLRPHAGRVLRVDMQGWPAVLPAWPALQLRLTPAGLLECVESADTAAPAPDLRLEVDASDPVRLAWGLATGERPAVQVSGDAALAADVDWVVTQVRWDIAADLERVLGPAPAQALSGLARALAHALRDLLPRSVAGHTAAPAPEPGTNRPPSERRPEGAA